MTEAYLWNTEIEIAEIRLIIEGAVALYEEDASGINRMMMASGNLIAAAGFDTIGEALYALRTHIRNMQQAHTKEVERVVAEELVFPN